MKGRVVYRGDERINESGFRNPSRLRREGESGVS